MKKEKAKLSLTEIKVESFQTNLSTTEQQTINGGTDVPTGGGNGNHTGTCVCCTVGQETQGVNCDTYVC